MAPVDEAVLDRVRQGMRGLKAPSHYDKVYKEECMYSFDTPFSPGGLYVNLKSFQVSTPLQAPVAHATASMAKAVGCVHAAWCTYGTVVPLAVCGCC